MKLAWKTFIAFALVLVLFAASIGILFGQLFRQNTLNAFKETLGERAYQLAETAATITSMRSMHRAVNGQGMQFGRGQRELDDYLAFLSSHDTEDIWLIDPERNILVSPDDVMAGRTLSEATLPSDAVVVVDRALQGDVVFSEQFSETVGQTTLTVGQPVVIDNQVAGALLLHAPVAGLEAANRQANEILALSLAAGLVLAAVVAFIFSHRLAKPLVQMNTNAAAMAGGDYSPRSNPAGRDEIADLGRSIDTLGERLQTAAEESRSMQASRQDFLATVSHELRTPVTVLRGLLEAWNDGVIDDPEQTRTQMLTETHQLERLITDLLELSRLQQHDFTLTRVELSITQVLEDAIRSMQPAAREKQIELTFQQVGKDEPLFGDYGRLKQMFLTVLDNAVRVSSPGSSVVVHYEDRMVEVRDHGPGIPAHELPRIFERYYQGAGSKGSSGLGLAISAVIAERHDIRIEVISKPGDTVFRFRLPDQDMTPALSR